MKRGTLNKAELQAIAKAYRLINDLTAKIPRINDRGTTEDQTEELLVRARNPLGELLRWQDYHGAWKEAQP